MSREIHFRAWDGKQMLGGSQFDVEAQTGKVFKITPDLQCLYKDWTLMQFTGLKDSKNIEIYEGDILLFFDEYLKVFFNTATACFDVEYIGGDCDSLVGENGWDNSHITVVGNIYQNPELISND